MRRGFVILSFLTVIGCQSQPENVREWRASDHDHTSEPGNDQVAVPPDGGTAPELAAHGLDEVTLVAWQQNCTRCHGVIGRGDGPQGPSMKATDLTNPAWQRSVKDEQIGRAIREGRGLMPPFALPESTVTGLVRLIRLLDLSRAERRTDTGASDAGAGDAGPMNAGVPDAGSAKVKSVGSAAATALPRAPVTKPPAPAVSVP
jgi:cytochrome c oxidase cbb3-type subunit 3